MKAVFFLFGVLFAINRLGDVIETELDVANVPTKTFFNFMFN